MSKTQNLHLQRKFYVDWYNFEKSKGSIDSGKTLVEFIGEKKAEVQEIITSENLKKDDIIDWVQVIQKIQETYNLPKDVTLTMLQKCVRGLSATGDISAIQDLLQHSPSQTLQTEHFQQETTKIDKIIQFQSDNEMGFAAEWLSNAIDSYGTKIGKFGEGFFQSFAKLVGPRGRIIVQTKTADEPHGTKIAIKKGADDYEINTTGISKTMKGTTVKFETPFNTKTISQLTQYLTKKFIASNRAKISINGKHINHPSQFFDISGNALTETSLPNVDVTIDTTGISITDSGKGMSKETLATKLLYPNDTGNGRSRPSDRMIREETPSETRLFFTPKTTKKQKTSFKLMIGGVVIQEFTGNTLGNIGEFYFDFPYFSEIEDSRNTIRVSKEVAYALGVAVDQIGILGDTTKQIEALECIGKIYDFLKNSPSGVPSEFNLTHILKKKISAIQKKLEDGGIHVLPAEKGLVKALGKQDTVFYISPEFVNFKTENLPQATQIQQISTTGANTTEIGEKFKFYSVAFDQDAPHDYLVLEKEGVVLINSKVTQETDDELRKTQLHIINCAINLNTEYQTFKNTKNFGRVVSETGETHDTDTSHNSSAESENGGQSSLPHLRNLYATLGKKITIHLPLEGDNHLLKLLQQVPKGSNPEETAKLLFMMNIFGVSGEQIARIENNNSDSIIKHLNKLQKETHTSTLDYIKQMFEKSNLDNNKNILYSFDHLIEIHTPFFDEVMEFISLYDSKVVSCFQDFCIALSLQGIRGKKLYEYAKIVMQALKSDPKTVMELIYRLGKTNNGYELFKKLETSSASTKSLPAVKEYTGIFMLVDNVRFLDLLNRISPETTAFPIRESEMRFGLKKDRKDDIIIRHIYDLLTGNTKYISREQIAQIKHGVIEYYYSGIPHIANQEVPTTHLRNRITSVHPTFMTDMKRRTQLPERDIFLYLARYFLIEEYYENPEGFDDMKNQEYIDNCIHKSYFQRYMQYLLSLPDEEKSIIKKFLGFVFQDDEHVIKNGVNVKDITAFIKAYASTTTAQRPKITDAKQWEKVVRLLEDHFSPPELTVIAKYLKYEDQVYSEKEAQTEKQYGYFANSLLHPRWKHARDLLTSGNFDVFESQYGNIPEQLNLLGPDHIQSVINFLATLSESERQKMQSDFLKYSSSGEASKSKNLDVYASNMKKTIPYVQGRMDIFIVQLLHQYFLLERQICSTNLSDETHSIHRESTFVYNHDKLKLFLDTPHLLEEEYGIHLPYPTNSYNNEVLGKILKSKDFHILRTFFLNNPNLEIERNIPNHIVKLLEDLPGFGLPLLEIAKICHNFFHNEQAICKKSENDIYDEDIEKVEDILNSGTPHNDYWTFEDILLGLDSLEAFNKKFGTHLKAVKASIRGLSPIIDRVNIKEIGNKLYPIEFMKLHTIAIKLGDIYTNKATKGDGSLGPEYAQLYMQMKDIITQVFPDRGININNMGNHDTDIDLKIESIIYELSCYYYNENLIIEHVIGAKKDISQKQTLSPEALFSHLSRDYPQDLVSFAMFLKNGGEFLPSKEKLQIVPPDTPGISTTLSDIIGMQSRTDIDFNDLSFDKLEQKLEKEKTYNNAGEYAGISGTIIAQDPNGSTMYWLREGVQNARDIILQTGSEKRDIDINFYQHNRHFVGSIYDPVGMDRETLIRKLLVPGNSGKTPGEGVTGQFGKGAYTFFAGCSSVTFKTGRGGDNGLTQYTQLIPKYGIKFSDAEREKKLVELETLCIKLGGDTDAFIDFFAKIQESPMSKDTFFATLQSINPKNIPEIQEWFSEVFGRMVIYDMQMQLWETQEGFKGTLIERVDESTGIAGNLKAMIGVNILKKYVGLVDNTSEESRTGVNVHYNQTLLNSGKKVEQTSGPVIGPQGKNLGDISLISSKDHISRFTKDKLYMSEIPEEVLDDFPDFVRKIIIDDGLTINVPDLTQLVGSRNALHNATSYYASFRPHIYTMLLMYVAKKFIDGKIRLPTLPDDYFGNTMYEYGSHKHRSFSKKLNSRNFSHITPNEYGVFKDSLAFSMLLTHIEFEIEGELTSAWKIKYANFSKLESEKKRAQRLGKGITDMLDAGEKLKTARENPVKYYKSISEVSQAKSTEFGITKQELESKIKNFEKTIYGIFGEYILKTFGKDYELYYYSGNNMSSAEGHVGGIGFNIDAIKNLIFQPQTPKNIESIITTVSHELAHGIERLQGKYTGTHEADEENDLSFLKIQRDILTQVLRNQKVPA